MRNQYKEQRRAEKRAALEAEAQQQEAERAGRYGAMFEQWYGNGAHNICNECGALVANPEVHFEWHQRFS